MRILIALATFDPILFMADLRSLIAPSRVDNAANPPPPKPGKSLRARIAAAWPLLLLLAFLLLLWLLFGDRLTGATEVALAPVVTLPATQSAAVPAAAAASPAGGSFEGAVLFQASGWIEAAPYPIRATTLIDGTIATVHVLEGDSVSRGQLLATLVDTDVKLDRATAVAALRQREAGLAAANANETAAGAQLTTLQLETATAEAHLAELQDAAQRLARIGSAAAPAGDISQARLRVASQQARIKALEARRPELMAARQARRADTRHAENALAEAQTELARRELALERTRITSPVDGVIQRLHVAPGMKRRLGMDDPESATIVTLYQPDSLQARIDVPLEAAAQIAIGQPVRIRSSLLQDQQFQGRVRQIEGQADIQRNTLQAKVILLNPDPRLRPDMLCRAEFLATPTAGEAAAQDRSRGLALYLPEAAILTDGEAPAVWKIDASGEHIIRQTIRTSGPPRDGHLEVHAGLKPGDRVVLNPAADLQSGERVKSR